MPSQVTSVADLPGFCLVTTGFCWTTYLMYALGGLFGGTLAGEVRHLTRLKYVPGRTVVHLQCACINTYTKKSRVLCREYLWVTEEHHIIIYSFIHSFFFLVILLLTEYLKVHLKMSPRALGCHDEHYFCHFLKFLGLHNWSMNQIKDKQVNWRWKILDCCSF